MASDLAEAEDQHLSWHPQPLRHCTSALASFFRYLSLYNNTSQARAPEFIAYYHNRLILSSLYHNGLASLVFR